jgi:hypothetical protein
MFQTETMNFVYTRVFVWALVALALVAVLIAVTPEVTATPVPQLPCIYSTEFRTC